MHILNIEAYTLLEACAYKQAVAVCSNLGENSLINDTKNFPMYKRHGNIKDSLRIEISKYYLLIMRLLKTQSS